MRCSQEQLDIVNELIRELKSRGYVVHRNNAYSTSSTYLKIDYGLGNSIIIADQEGIFHLKYRYNIRKDLDEYKEEVDINGLIRKYYTFSDWKGILDDIDAYVAEKKDRYGECWYRKQMQLEKQKAELAKKNKEKGFWLNAFLVE